MQMNARLHELPRHKRILRILGGVSASVLVSPVLAAVAVGVGVPILLGILFREIPFYHTVSVFAYFACVSLLVIIARAFGERIGFFRVECVCITMCICVPVRTFVRC